jgi:hypothetical protein
MSQPFNIQNDTVVITKLSVDEIVNAVSVNELSVDTLHVKNLIETEKPTTEVGQWAVQTEDQLNGKGFSWTWGNGSAKLQYRAGERIWTNVDFDVAESKGYSIDGIRVLSRNELGRQITKSNLREVGTLNDLEVAGDVNIGEYAFFKTNFQRLGINTDNPSNALSIVENEIEIAIGSKQIGRGYIGTHTNHDLVLGTDNTSRILLKNNGEIIFGNEQAKNSVVRIYGELFVDAITTDNRTDRYSPLQFNATRDTGVYGLGLEWVGAGASKLFVMKEGPDRLWTTESLDLAYGQAYHINGTAVITETALGRNITNSNLTNLGTLHSLTVSGGTALLGDVDASSARVRVKALSFNDGTQQLSIDNYKIDTSNQYTISVRGQDSVYVDSTEIALGTKNNPKRPVKIFGQLSVGINNPNPKLALAVEGNIGFANRSFSSGSSAPTQGISNVGDIVWNDNPTAHGYVGWVCTVAGDPGTWLSFGAISSQ